MTLLHSESYFFKKIREIANLFFINLHKKTFQISFRDLDGWKFLKKVLHGKNCHFK